MPIFVIHLFEMVNVQKTYCKRSSFLQKPFQLFHPIFSVMHAGQCVYKHRILQFSDILIALFQLVFQRKDFA